MDEEDEPGNNRWEENNQQNDWNINVDNNIKYSYNHQKMIGQL